MDEEVTVGCEWVRFKIDGEVTGEGVCIGKCRCGSTTSIPAKWTKLPRLALESLLSDAWLQQLLYTRTKNTTK